MLIKLKDYERIFQIVSAVIESEGGDTSHSCIHYSIFGANILSDHFGLRPKVRCGFAAYHLGEDQQVLCFGEKTPLGMTCTSDGFHCWIEADGWLIDFMAPRFGELKATAFTMQPKMFQRRGSQMSGQLNEMK